MATDATGTPSSLGIPRLNLVGDRPTGLAINEIVDAIDAIIVAHSVNMPSGAMMVWGGTSAPTGWLLCDGTTYSTTTHASLFAAISSNYGTGGAGTFKVPDTRGRTFIGAGTGAGLSARSLGQVVGEEVHQIVTAELPPHAHSTVNGVLGGFGQAVGLGAAGSATLWGVPSGQGSLDQQTSSIGSGTAHNNMQPSVVGNWIIKD